MTEILPPNMPDDDMINEALQFINERIAVHALKGSIEVGDYVLAKFFNSDLQLAGSQNGHKAVSYNKLCRHPALSVSRPTLTGMVKTAAQEQFLTGGGIAADQLKYGHKLCLTRLENNEEKLELARECIDEGLTVGKLEVRVQEVYAESLNLPVTPAVAVKKYLTRIELWIRRVNSPDGMTDRSLINAMTPSEKERILDAAGGILEDMSVITNKIQQLVTILTEAPAPPEIESPTSEAA